MRPSSAARLSSLGLCLLLSGLLAGCDLMSADDARLQIQLTDAPTDFIESAEVWISHVFVACDDEHDDHDGEHLFMGATTESGAARASDAHHDDDHEDDEHEGRGEDDEDHCERVDLFHDAGDPFHVDLLDLHHGLVANLTVPVDLPEGHYDELFVVIDSAFVTLKAPHKFPNGSSTMALHLPTHGAATIKVQLEDPIDLHAGETTRVLLDFDADDSFVLLGTPGGSGGVKGILFDPHLTERQR